MYWSILPVQFDRWKVEVVISTTCVVHKVLPGLKRVGGVGE